jgi:TatA/E family protein of Tat protein translocase
LGTLLIVLLIVVLLFGERLARVSREIGEGVRNFKRAVAEPGDEPKAEPEPPPKPEVRLVPPKLLPAKGETTRRPGETDDETNDHGDEGKV